MRRFFGIIFASLTLVVLPACTTPSGGSGGVGTTIPSVCERTVADEKALVGAQLAYKAFRVAVETGVNAGFISGTLAGRVAAADNRAFAALTTADTVYRTCSGDLNAALASANQAIGAGLALVPDEQGRER